MIKARVLHMAVAQHPQRSVADLLSRQEGQTLCLDAKPCFNEYVSYERYNAISSRLSFCEFVKVKGNRSTVIKKLPLVSGQVKTTLKASGWPFGPAHHLAFDTLSLKIPSGFVNLNEIFRSVLVANSIKM